MSTWARKVEARNQPPIPGHHPECFTEVMGLRIPYPIITCHPDCPILAEKTRVARANIQTVGANDLTGTITAQFGRD